jgi:acyl-CoA thioesterase YciA
MEPRDSPPDREPAIRMIAMPVDANPSGDIFGGYIMSLMGSISPNY